MREPLSPLRLLIALFLCALLPVALSVKCLDCVGMDCMGTFCEGDYCVLSRFAPRWGATEFGKPSIVKGCMSGKMLRSDVRDHCEVSEEDDEVFTCFCNGKDNCNGGKTQRKLERENVELITCVCSGEHCGRSETCIGELCSYVLNHKSKEVEQGCVNASVPIVERRSAGSCMIPPITGAMHHNVAKEAKDLLVTESCVCGSDYCNADKPETTKEEKMKCPTYVNAELMGNKMRSKNVTCTGEYCFKARMKTSISSMKEYETAGCASFSTDAELAEELHPVGCARFESEAVSVEACFQTKDKRAIARARANQQVVERERERKKTPKGSHSPTHEHHPKQRPPRPPPKVEVEEINDEEEEEEEEENGAEETPVKDEREEEGGEGEGESEGEEEGEKKEEKVEVTTSRIIFEKPTQPPLPDDSNTMMITVFILIMLCIVAVGAVWKFELHKRLFRANYDTVAGG